MGTFSREASRFFAFLIGMVLVIAAVFAGCSLYERSAVGEYRLGIGGAPYFTPYYLVRLLVAGLLSLLLVAGLHRLGRGAAESRKPDLSQPQRAVVYTLLAFAAGWLALFVIRPHRFYTLALEDGPVEWLSSLLPLASSAAFFYAFFRVLRSGQHGTRRRVALVFTLLFAAVLFFIGMEEISWMQRVFNVETPALLHGNEQQETNLHNMYSSLFFNIVYRTGVFAGLIVLPFLAETAPENHLFAWIADFLPTRFVLAASAPLVGFDYNFWNFFLGPLLLTLALVILVFYAVVAHKRGNSEESLLFGLLAAFAVLSQATFLLLGARAGHTWVISEYRELLLAVGWAAFTWDITRRLLARYRATAAAAGALPA